MPAPVSTYRPTAPVGSQFTAHSSLAGNASFSAKERDTETGLSYFGARYYSSDLSLWLSVDPMSDKYPSFSPYVYCANNPVKLVDPNGEFDTRAETRQYRREHHTGGVIKKKTNEHDRFSGNYSIINKREGVAYTKPNYQKDELDPPILGQDADNVVRSTVITPQESGRWAGSSVMSAEFLISGVLAEDDVTIVGIADDVAIPIVIAAGALVAYSIHLMSQHGTNNGRLNPEELNCLRAKEKNGTLTPKEKQKLKRHDKNTGVRHFRKSKDN